MSRRRSPWREFRPVKTWRQEIASLLLLTGLIAGACGGGETKPPSTPASKIAATATSTSAADQSAAAEIDQVNLTFTPNKVTVKVGERVRFKSSDDAIHTVNINGKNISGNMKKGDVIYWTAPKAGTYKVTCDYHPQMIATITVQ